MNCIKIQQDTVARKSLYMTFKVVLVDGHLIDQVNQEYDLTPQQVQRNSDFPQRSELKYPLMEL